ncbi:hypothetical protein B0H14DRAFT_2616394 [Mycena olivaceomarginata]|nr:hypothetical protein B0H14DRAFT_2616394 [Mycena olivaceomarginata]
MPGEWEHVKVFLSMHSVIPALESLHRAWTTRSKKPACMEFMPALDAGLVKVAKYYDKITDSDAYIFCMILNPGEKVVYFQPHWSAELQKQVLDVAEKIFKRRWIELRAAGRDKPIRVHKKAKLARLLAVDLHSDSEEEALVAPSSEAVLLHMPDFRKYIDAVEEVPEDMSLVMWWGLASDEPPPISMLPGGLWPSIIWQFKPLLSQLSAIFSAGGITISKHYNRLGGDLVKALQFMKSALHRETLFHDIPSSTNEPMLVADESDDGDSAALEEGFGVWDACLADGLDEGEDDEDIEEDFSSLFTV